MDLSSPDCLDPAVTLSGEVEGLKPPAVADKPMEPRVFIVSRTAEATELVSFLLALHWELEASVPFPTFTVNCLFSSLQ